jgi:hypothetical protein
MKFIKTILIFAFAIVFPVLFLAILFCMGMFQLTKFLIIKGYNKCVKPATPSARIEPSMTADQ